MDTGFTLFARALADHWCKLPEYHMTIRKWNYVWQPGTYWYFTIKFMAGYKGFVLLHCLHANLLSTQDADEKRSHKEEPQSSGAAHRSTMGPWCFYMVSVVASLRQPKHHYKEGCICQRCIDTRIFDCHFHGTLDVQLHLAAKEHLMR